MRKPLLRPSVVNLAVASSLLALALSTPNTYAQGTFQKSSVPMSYRLQQLASQSLAGSSRAQQDAALNLPTVGAGSLQRDADGAVLVSIRVGNTSAETQAAIRATGAEIRHVSELFSVIDAYVPTSALNALTLITGVSYVDEALAPRSRSQLAAGESAPPAQTTAATCPTGVVTEGDSQLKANTARSTYGLSGSGIKIGVVSDSYNQNFSVTSAAQDIANGELPGAANPCGHTTPVQVVAEGPGGTDEGRAMIQIVHDLAPNATLAFATAGGSMYEMADNIRALGNAGSDLVTDDIVFFGEPAFQDGPISVAITENAAKGIAHFTAAGNANLLDGTGRNITSYEASAYRPTTCPAMPNLPPSSRPKDCHDFAPGAQSDPTSTFNLDDNNGGFLLMDFQWAEPWYGVTDDLDVFVIDNATGRVIGGSIATNTGSSGSQRPQELFQFNGSPAQNVSVVIGRASGNGTPRIKWVLQSGGGINSTEYNASTNSVDRFGPSVGDHVATPEAIGVGAVAYNDSTRPEYFSSLGPAAHYIAPVKYSASAEPPIVQQPSAVLAQPVVMNKPDFGATDGGRNSFFGSGGSPWRFYGTSAAAPHAAGVAALVLERANQLGIALTPSALEQQLESTASQMVNGNSAANGTGLVNAMGAMSGFPSFVLTTYIEQTNN